eukprot:g1346.t1
MLWLKRKSKTPRVTEDGVHETVSRMLREIQAGGEEKVLQYARELDGFDGDVAGGVVVSEQEFAEAERSLNDITREDIRMAHDAIRAFATAQRDSVSDLCREDYPWPGMVTGHRLIAVDVAGCYVPGGRFAHVASALMTVATARAAGVQKVVVCSPPRRDTGRIHAGVLFAAKLAGADHVITLGGVQAICALAYGLFSGCRPASVIVGPGNRFVVEAKKQLFAMGQVGIDIIAGPTETCCLADEDADVNLIATDLVGQAEHGHDSPAVLVTTSRHVAEQVLALIPEKIASLQENQPQTAAAVAWRDYGEIIIASTREEMCAISDEIASEHLQVHCRREELPWYHSRLRNYGSLFLGEETNVSYGDKCSGPNHVLPTRLASRYSGGLSVHSFLKRLSFQQIVDPVAAKDVGSVTARISRLEGMEGHARSADERLRKYLGEKAYSELTLHPPMNETASNTEPGSQRQQQSKL